MNQGDAMDVATPVVQEFFEQALELLKTVGHTATNLADETRRRVDLGPLITSRPTGRRTRCT